MLGVAGNPGIAGATGVGMFDDFDSSFLIDEGTVRLF